MTITKNIQVRFLISLGSLVLYAVFFVAVYPYAKSASAMLTFIPAIIFGWLLGVHGGWMFCLFALPLNSYLFKITGASESYVQLGHLVGTGGAALVGSGVGWVKELSDRVKQQARALYEEHKLLQAEIVKRVQAEKHMVEAQRIAHVGNFACDFPSGAFLYVSKEFRRICEMNPGKSAGVFEVLLKHVHPDDHDRVRPIIKAYLEASIPFSAEYRIVASDNTEKTIHARGEITFDEYGAPFQGVGTFQDISEQKKAEAIRLEIEQRLVHSQKLESLGVIAGGIAHNFNNLLAVILGNMEMSQLDTIPGSIVHENITRAIAACNRAANLTRQMLAYSGKEVFRRGKTDVNEIVRGNAEIIQALLDANVSLDIDTAGDLPLIEGDKGQIQQGIMNLLINALEAIGTTPGVITVRTGVQDCDEKHLSRSRVEEKPPPGRFVFVEVTDTGCGMEKATMDRLFEPFFTTKATGRGLGMPALLGVIRAHQGAILMESEIGKGTTFRLLIPIRV